MRRLNLLFTLTSLNVVLVTIERFSFTTKVLLQPDNFLRLHEVVQILLLILFTVLIPFFILKEVTNNFELLKTKNGTILGAVFIAGIYLYATGNGVHELASFLFNTFCNVKAQIFTFPCNSMFINDYYFGNILFFIGAILMNVSLLVLERIKPTKPYEKNDLILLVINSLVFALTIIAYAAFDRVLVGLVYSVIMTIVIALFFITNKQKKTSFPYTLYSTIAYFTGTIISLLIRFH